jgi:hypothetical protein
MQQSSNNTIAYPQLSATATCPTQQIITSEFTDEEKAIMHMVLDKIKAKTQPANGQPAETLESAIDQAVRELVG